MNYRIQKIEMNKALGQVQDYEYALVYMISEVLLCRTSKLPEVDWQECMEARFFDREKELHIYEEDGQLQAVEIIDSEEEQNEQENCLVRRYQIANRFREAGKLLRVHEYLDYDEDGQAAVSLTRLAGIEEV